MNNRILELAEHANYLATEKEFPYDEDWFYLYNKKFAELLIQDCCKAIENWKKEPFPFDEDLAVELIHQNFGLELTPKNIKVIKI
jgi:hypothetical protein